MITKKEDGTQEFIYRTADGETKDGDLKCAKCSSVAYRHCPSCGDCPPHTMSNYDMMWHEADIHCKSCGTFVRTWDAG